MRLYGRLLNRDGEMVAEGLLELNPARMEITMWPEAERHPLSRQQGELTLDLEDGRRLRLSDRHMTFRVATGSNPNQVIYRLRVLQEEAASAPAGGGG